jgi:hypothetical protein
MDLTGINIACRPLHGQRQFTQTLRMMRLMSFFLLAGFLQVSATVHSQKVTLNERNASLEKLFSSIKQQTGYTFYYQLELLEKQNPQTIKFRDLPVSEAIKVCLENTSLDYKIIGKTVVLNKKEVAVPKEEINEMLPQPPIEVKGRVVNENNEPIAGISIVIKGTQRGTTTTNDGSFVLANVPENAVLVFSK